MAVIQAQVVTAGKVCELAAALRSLVDDAASRDDVLELAAGAVELAGLVAALPPPGAAKSDVSARVAALAMSKTAGIHLRRAGVEVSHERGCRLASDALGAVVASLEVAG